MNRSTWLPFSFTEPWTVLLYALVSGRKSMSFGGEKLLSRGLTSMARNPPHSSPSRAPEQATACGGWRQHVKQGIKRDSDTTISGHPVVIAPTGTSTGSLLAASSLHGCV